jgi:hypothetical protein
MVGQSLTPEKFRHVNDHLTPLAVLVVLPGVLLAALSRADVWLSVGLLAYAVLMNYVSVLVPSRNVQRLAKFRVGSNYVVNVALVWMLYRVWPSVWLLLLLMSVGPALYQSRRDATLTGVAVAVLLLAIHALSGTHSALAWAEAGVKACAIVVFSLFVSGLPAVAERREAASGLR